MKTQYIPKAVQLEIQECQEKTELENKIKTYDRLETVMFISIALCLIVII
jgi:hypothetical protein